MSVYPSGLDSFTPVVSGVSEIRSVDINDLQGSISAVQNTIGISGNYNFSNVVSEYFNLSYTDGGTAQIVNLSPTHTPKALIFLKNQSGYQDSAYSIYTAYDNTAANHLISGNQFAGFISGNSIYAFIPTATVADGNYQIVLSYVY